MNSHTTAYHLDFYRESIRPLKDTKAINRDSYLRQKQKDPEKVKKARVMSRMRKKARQKQIDRIERAALPLRPTPPNPPEINASNPFYVIKHQLRIFIGVKKADLIDFPVATPLEAQLEPSDNTPSMIQSALVELQEIPIVTLVTRYHHYRKAMQGEEDYPETLELYEKRYLTQEHKQLVPESYIDEELVQADAEKLYDQYLRASSRRQKALGNNHGGRYNHFFHDNENAGPDHDDAGSDHDDSDDAGFDIGAGSDNDVGTEPA